MRILLCFLVFACARPKPPHADERATMAMMSPAWVADAAARRSLGQAVDTNRGLVLVEFLGCESDEVVEQARHYCGEEQAKLWTILDDQLERMSRTAQELGPPITCSPTKCRIPPSSECVPQVDLYFAEDMSRGPVLVGIVERDDWQHPDSPEADAEMQRKQRMIDEAFAKARGCR